MGLSGPGFCQDPSLGLSEEQVAGCQGFIKAFMPAAMKTLFVDNPQMSNDMTSYISKIHSISIYCHWL